MKTLPPTVFPGSIAEAFDKARATVEPLFVPAPHHADDRGWSLMNLLQGVMGPAGQVNFSVQHPGVIKAWHRHRLQTDFWVGLLGHLKVGVARDQDDRRWAMVIGEKRPGVLVIPPTLWHGAATVGPEPAGLLYYVTHPYNAANPDEERRPFDGVAGFPWAVENR